MIDDVGAFEPCDDCDTGLCYWFGAGFDGRRRCRNCIYRLGAELGWDAEVAAYMKRWESGRDSLPAPSAPVEHPLIQARRRKKVVDENQQALGLP